MAYTVNLNNFDIPSNTYNCFSTPPTLIDTINAARSGSTDTYVVVVGNFVALGWFDSTGATLKGYLMLVGQNAQGTFGPYVTGDKIYGNCSVGAARVVASEVHT